MITRIRWINLIFWKNGTGDISEVSRQTYPINADGPCSWMILFSGLLESQRWKERQGVWAYDHTTSDSGRVQLQLYDVMRVSRYFAIISKKQLQPSQFPDLKKASFFTLTTYFRHSLKQSFSMFLTASPCIFLANGKGAAITGLWKHTFLGFIAVDAQDAVQLLFCVRHTRAVQNRHGLSVCFTQMEKNICSTSICAK